MKNTMKAFLGLVLVLLCIACNKDDAPETPKPDTVDNPDPKPEPEPVNNPPGTFGLISPEADNEHEGLLPTFSWEAAIDPDGDAVTYDVFIGTETDPQTLLASGITDTIFTATENLELFETYNWKVIAKDSKNAEISSETKKFKVEPLLYITEFNRGGELINFNYTDNGQLTELYDLVLNEMQAIFYGPDGRISTFVNPKTGSQNYDYDDEGRLIHIEGSNIKTIDVTYSTNGQIIKIVKGDDYKNSATVVYDQKSGLPFQVLDASLNENNEIIDERRYTFSWDDSGNLVKKLIEHDRKDGNGFEYKEDITYAYDRMQNPNFYLVRDKLGFQQLDVYQVNTLFSGGSSLGNALRWRSRNNVVKEIYRYDNGVVVEQSTSLEYTYNEEGFPIHAELYRINPNGESTSTYTYKYIQ